MHNEAMQKREHRSFEPDTVTSGASKVKRRLPPSSMADADAQRLLHELEVHQFELEAQNEELRAARAEAETTLTRYTELFDFAPIGYITLSAQGNICELNHRASELLDNHRSRLVGKRFSSLVDVDDQPLFAAALTRALSSGEREVCELRLLRPGNTTVMLHVTTTALPGTDGRVLLAFDDITEQSAREQKLADTERALREADRRKDEFLAVLSHELRNPLAPIRNSVFVLAHSEPGGDKAQKAQVIIDRQVTHLTRLIDDLLDVTRIARGKVELQRRRIELAALARATLDDHRTSFEALGIELVDEIDAEPSVVDADPARLVQVLSNLLGNSLKFTPRGGRVVVRLENLGASLELSVIDNGAGISPDTIRNLFVPFAQGPQSMDRARGGLGLGLAMAKGLVELHGGRVTIASPGLGQGTRVTVELPRQTVIAEREQTSAPVSVRSRRVLLIEDNLDASETLRDALTLIGHQVKVAHDGVLGLELAREFRPEVVICDIGLPGMDGYEVARAFRRDAALRHIPLVAWSGYAHTDDLKRALQSGFQYHLAKPASLDSLERVLAEAARAAREHAAPASSRA